MILVGRVAGAFGVKGEVRISAYTEDPMALLGYRVLLREGGEAGLTLESGRAQKKDFVGRAAEVSTREDAERLRGLRLYVPRAALPVPDEDEFYLVDLLGLEARSPQGEALGKIRSVQDFGAGDLLEIAPERGASWWVAFTKETAPIVNIAGGFVTVVRPTEDEAEA
jgi:16S rRNA processing protein RimM